MQKPLVIVSAGAGYGKSLAVHSFLQDYDAIKVWVQLSERDNLGTRFWENFVGTISLRNKPFAERLLMLGFPETEDQLEKYVSLIESEILPPRKRVVVFDDFHLIHEKSVLRFMEKALKSSFQNITTVLISRTDPDINTVRLLSRGMVFTVNEDDLRLTEGEIARYFQLLGISLPPQSIADIYGDTRGWVLAVNLISLSLKKSPSQEKSARIAMKLNIFKMMETEVFLVISDRLRRFLIRLSLIDHLSAELVLILAEGDEALVEELKKINSFVRFDIYLHAYLIHHIFLDFLRQKQSVLSDEEKRDTYLKAARWCYENDYKMDAISYYERAGEYKAIVDIVYDFPIQFPFDQAKFILGVYDRAPAHLMEGFERYHRQYSTLLLSLGLYEKALADVKERIEKYLSLPSSDLNNGILCGAYISLGIADYLMAPNTDRYDFYLSLEKAYRYFNMSRDMEPGPVIKVALSALVSKVGTTRPGAMEEYLDAMTRFVPLMGSVLNGCMYGMDDLARGELLFYKSDLKNAVKFLKQALYKAEERNQYEVRNRALFYLLRVAVSDGDFGEIQAILKSLEEQLVIKEYHARFKTFDIVSSWFYAFLDRPCQIAHWIRSGNFGKSFHGTFRVDFVDFVRAKCYYSDKRYHELLSFIESEPAFTEVLFGKLEIKLLEAACQYQLKNRGASMTALREAYELSYTNRLTMPFVELGKDMRTLTRAALRDENRGIPVEWLEMINRKSSTYSKRLLLILSEYKKANNIKDDTHLSARETEILQDLYEGLSRAEIAANRDLSISTVKMVLNTLYAKLGANSLADVIRIAISLNLIKT
jgi:LuxR family maltose regulon positive regulatory protein